MRGGKQIDKDLCPKAFFLCPVTELDLSQEGTEAVNASPLLVQVPEGGPPLPNPRAEILTELDKKRTIGDRPALRRAAAQISVKLKDKKLTILMRTRLTGMRALMNFFLDLDLQFQLD